MIDDHPARRKKIRVAVDARPLSTPTSGVARVISRILQFFPDKEKYEFLLYSHKAWHSDFDDVISLPNVIWIQGRGVTSHRGGIWFNVTLPGIISRGDVDIFWGSQQIIPPFLPSRIPVVLTYYDLVLYLYPEAMRPIARIQQRMFQRYSVKRAKKILTISDQTGADLIRKFSIAPEIVKTALLGYDEPAGAKNKKKVKEHNHILPFTNPYFLAVSTLEPRKNYGTLLSAYEQILKSDPNFKYRLVIAGRRGWESQEFFTRLNSMIDSGKVCVLEGISDTDLESLYKNSAFFVMPSLYEGFGLPLLEALVVGRPALASDIPCFHEIGKELIEYIEPLDIDRWAEMIEKYAGEHSQGRLKKIAFPASEWTWERTARLHQEAFDELPV